MTTDDRRAAFKRLCKSLGGYKYAAQVLEITPTAVRAMAHGYKQANGDPYPIKARDLLALYCFQRLWMDTFVMDVTKGSRGAVLGKVGQKDVRPLS